MSQYAPFSAHIHTSAYCSYPFKVRTELRHVRINLRNKQLTQTSVRQEQPNQTPLPKSCRNIAPPASSEMDTPADSLPSREEFLANLDHNVSQESITCSICFQDTTTVHKPLQSPPSDEEKPERTLIAHGNHKFGERCITEWLKSKNSCPLCRKQLFTLPEPEPTPDEAEHISRDGPPQLLVVVREGQRHHIIPLLTTEEAGARLDANPEIATIQSEILAHQRIHHRMHAYFDEMDRLELMDHVMVQRIQEVGLWHAGAWRLLRPYLSLTGVVLGLGWLCFRMSMSRVVRIANRTYVRRPSVARRIFDFVFLKLGQWRRSVRVLAHPFGLFTGDLRQ
ncbi:hypothetical protein AC578_9447 [Pseudocercospora eumusae]|uniref:RING-type domain-containing protein n=1 Tax=Pseudocercospora eumusae TaxID=321146 RepID=A0A139GYG7_9PEZI|nr:hypothetical protein AC578_9447 [Pseudocercospora eumusae]